MRKFLRMTIGFMLVLGLCISGTISTNAQVQSVPNAGVFINGKVVSGINPIIENGVYYLPFIDLAKILNYNSIKFEEKTKTYEITDGSTVIRITMGGTRAKKGNEYINVEPPRWINETPYVSLHTGGAIFNSYITFKKENGSIQIQNPATKYIVHTGDTLFNIARIHHITVDELKKANNLTTNIIHDGQVLNLPSPDASKGEMEPVKEKEPVKNDSKDTVAQQIASILADAKKYIGAKYKYGATLAEAPNMFDCSSYTQYVFGNSGIQLPRVSRDQASKGVSVATSNLKAGDLMFFTMKDTYTDGRVAHVGIYMGDGSMIHASTSKGVMISTNVLQNPYWSKNYLFSKRVVQ
ncbi:LysM peptidoglycan-binding domain-containing C40 family peptidase [Ureibacillus chungkukjangi]|uniref:Cell wall-associated NlpC family hydrolase n=1 Tax=Ureibacillus chungkukjangi TaxID=1202712 RepID=A0A318TQ61_9BACL|nr:LysM peptidoglycan-binding domain-containing C40 family peptidase [Ureibacillus chungkukjangi]MCM3389381.1 NlpC/P60 family protein [Ureibacillus chungkukjangi]PYF05148.1 cell wall-associated NlpC family hydrolase [Ureibacillus chungkukjangi]